jgi:hypothetical protein
MSELFNKQVKKGEEKSNINPISVNTADGKKMIYDVSPKTLTGMSMKQINTKGKSFPMVQPNEMMQQKEMMQPMNRAGRPADSNILTNDPNIPQPPNKVPASMNNRNQMFNSIASDQGQVYPPTFGMYDGPEFNPGLKQASAEGKLDNNPKFKAAVDNAPGMYMMKGEGERNVIANLDITKGKKEDYEVKGTKEYNKLQKEYKGDIAQYLDNRFPKRKNKGQSTAPSLGMYDDGMSMHGMNHAHTHVTSKNVKSAEKDDAAHIDYLKRDINYDAKHGGSDKQMTDDEKHISKLAGDIKYDHKHHGRKYDNV